MAAATEDRRELQDISEVSDSANRRLDSRTLWWLVLVFTLLPLVISAVTMMVTVGNSYYPWGDWAGMELLVRDVGHHSVLVGLYSRDGWSHPGPILFYLLAVPYRLTGSSSVGLQLGALLINGSAIVAMAVVTRRRGGTPLLLCTLLGCGLLVRTLGPHFVRDPWVCYITVIPFGLMILLSWSMACGEIWALPAAVGVASFLVQTHIGYVILALPLLAWGGLALLWRVMRDRSRSDAASTARVGTLVRAGVIAAVIVAVMWLPPLIDQLVHHPGNVSLILRWIQKGKAHTLVEGYRVVGAQFGWLPEWLTHHRRPLLFGQTPFLSSAPLPVLLVLPCAAAFGLWRLRAKDAFRLLVTIAVGLIAGVVAVARTVGIEYDYRLRWTWVLGMMAFVVVTWTAWLLIRARSSLGDRWLVSAALCAIVGLSIVNSISAARARIEPAHQQPSTTLAALVPQVIRSLPDRRGDVVFRATSPASGFYISGLLLRLERDGVTARVESNPGYFYGRSRTHGKKAPLRAFLTVAAGADFDTLSARPGKLRLIAYYLDRSTRDRSRILARRSVEAARLDADRKAGRINDVEYLRRVTRLPNPGLAVGVYESPQSSDG